MQVPISIFAIIFVINVKEAAFSEVASNPEMSAPTAVSPPLEPVGVKPTISRSGDCPYKQGVHLMTKPINRNDGEAFTSQVTDMEKSREALLKTAIYYGEGTTGYRTILREVNSMMRENYKKNIKGVGDNIYPLIITSDYDPLDPVSGVGSTFTLYLADGTSKRISPTPPEYEILKNIAHIPLGVYVIVGPYLRAPFAQGWVGPAKGLQAKLYDAIRATEYGKLDVNEKVVSNGLKVFKATVLHIENWVKKGSVSVEDFETFTRDVYPAIEESVTHAASLQANALIPALKQWKDELGPEWENTYFLIPTVWPVSATNPRHQALLQVVSPEQARSHIIMVQNQVSIQDHRATLGRIVGDRAATLLIFGTKTQTQREFVFGLSSAQDFLSISFERAIQEYISKTKSRKSLKIKKLRSQNETA